MACSLRLETLNIWGGRLYHALLAYIRRQADNVDIFCFQEVYTTRSDHLWARDDFALPSPLRVSVKEKKFFAFQYAMMIKRPEVGHLIR
ncbi:MAG: hypothetical protein ACJ8CB_16455 [Ktedonobacteraceae bacterium]